MSNAATPPLPDAEGHFGPYGGRFVPETLMHPLKELEEEYFRAQKDPEFQRELQYYLKEFCGRPTPLYFSERLTRELGGAKIYLKREDLMHTGSHKINNALGQVLLARRMGKTRIIAETGAGQHGVATATVSAMFGLKCVIYMGAVDCERQALNVYRMKMLGADVVSVKAGQQTLKEAVNEAMRDWVTNVRDTHYILGTAYGSHPYPVMVRNFQRVIGDEARAQILEKEKRLPDLLIACVGGGSNAIGLFYPFLEDKSVKMVGVEAGGEGIKPGRHAARFQGGSLGVLQGTRSYILQDAFGQIELTHSVSAGLDYAAVGPEHAWLKDEQRAEYTYATDEKALEAFVKLARLEGIIPALESAHAVAEVIQRAPKLGKDKLVIVNLSGRGDKDVAQAADKLGLEMPKKVVIARVSLEIALRKEFDYLIPPGLLGQVDVGSRVQVPFGPRKVMGCVTALAEESGFAKLKPILKVIGAQTLVTPRVLELARWIADYYCCAPEQALKSVLPEAVRREKSGFRERLFVRALPANGDLPKLPKKQLEVWNIIEERREMPLADLLELTKTTASTVRRLEDRGLVEIANQVSERDPYAREHILPSQPLPLNPQQSVALEAITKAMDNVGGAGVSPVVSGVPPETVAGGKALRAPTNQQPVKSRDEVRRDAELDPRDAGATRGNASGTTFLLHGVTGSGKTEVYLQALEHALSQGKGAMVLVPEISLTPQTVERFKSRFCHGPNQTLVAVLHSHLSAGERHDEWHKIRQGRARVVIGARSAIFAPIEPLGLVIVDEEHEHTYKQEETPRYNARDVAILRAQREGAVVVLGSATPSMESYYNCRKGKYTLLEMPERVDNQKMPYVRVVDMRQAARDGKGTPTFSPQLKEAITQRLERKEQTILFLNRRGFSTSLQCPKCGYVAECPNCSLSLTYHRPEQNLRCHLCAHVEPAPTACPKCKNPAIRYSGLGTQKVEDTLKKIFPKARVQRMDSDILKRKEDYRRILGDFRTGKIDILIGTQMIAKGLHFPNVTLVGIIHADMALHQPDFRAGERTFQLLTQVSGRAGRGDVEGEVFVQAFTPFHPAIQFARRHDFEGFYEQEMEMREQLKYPPLSRVAQLTLKGRNEEKVKFSADHLKRELEKHLKDFKDLTMKGPAPAVLLRAEGSYRYQITLFTRSMSKLSHALAKIVSGLTFPDDVSLTVDIDPVNLM